MIYYSIGSIGFLLFFLYDLNQLFWGKKILTPCFMVGFFCLIAAVFGVIIRDFNLIWLHHPLGIGIAFMTVLCFFLLVYTLFFALPFRDTYVKQAEIPVCDRGMYAVCRHPGVLWLFFFLLFAAFTLRSMTLFWEALLFTAYNVAYVVFQDKVTFMRLLKDYDAYKKRTPFLVPTLKSMKTALKTMN